MARVRVHRLGDLPARQAGDCGALLADRGRRRTEPRPRDFVIQGSNDGSTWTDLDKRAGEKFSGRFATRTYSFTNTNAYGFYRLNVTANSGDSLVQLADWNISDGSDVRPPATPMVSEATAGPNGGYTTKPDVGFTGLAALRYSGGAEGNGRSYATNKLFDVTIRWGRRPDCRTRSSPSSQAGTVGTRPPTPPSTCTSPTAAT